MNVHDQPSNIANRLYTSSIVCLLTESAFLIKYT
jgi:hypothetical protein